MTLDQLPWEVPGGQQVQFTPYQIGTKTGGDAQVVGTGAISSENYAAGSAGWRIDGAGNVEFASGEFRGDISGASGTFTGSLQIGTPPNAFYMNSGAFWIGSESFATAPFRVTPLGQVYADSYYLLDGTIQQTNLTVNGGTITSGVGMSINNGIFLSSAMSISAGVIDTPEIDGAATIVPAGQLASDNWVAGVAGWAIDGLGNAEFNNITARGALATGATGSERVIVGRAGNALVEFYTGDGDEVAAGYINSDVDNSGAVDNASLVIVGPRLDAGTPGYIEIRSGDDGSRNVVIGDAGLIVTDATSFLDNVFVAASKRLFLPDGAASGPSMSFTNDQNTGMFSIGADQLGFATGGVLRFTMTNTAMFAPGMATTTAAGLAVERFGSAGNELYAETSTGMLKANQRDADDMVPKLLALQPRMWDALSKDSDGNVTVTDEVKAEHNRGVTFDRPGFIVEEMANVWPEAVIFDDEIQPVGLDRMALITALVQAAKQFDQRLRLLELG